MSQPYVVKVGLSPTAHIVHGVLTVMTCGIWAPVWIMHWIIASKEIKQR